MKGVFEFDISEWTNERDAIVAKYDKGENNSDSMEKLLHYANSTLIEELFIRHFLFRSPRCSR